MKCTKTSFQINMATTQEKSNDLQVANEENVQEVINDPANHEE